MAPFLLVTKSIPFGRRLRKEESPSLERFYHHIITSSANFLPENACTNARQVRVNQDYHKKAKDLDARLGGDQQDGFEAELKTFGRDGVVLRPIVLRPIVGAFGEMSSHVDLLADAIADAQTAEHLSYCGDRGSKTVKAYYRRVL